MASTATVTVAASGGTYVEYKIAVACDATPSAVPDSLLSANGAASGDVCAVGIKCPASGYPSTVTMTIKDRNGLPIFTGSFTGSANLVTRLALTDGNNDGRSSFIGQLTVSFSGNTTASATWNTYVMVY